MIPLLGVHHKERRYLDARVQNRIIHSNRKVETATSPSAGERTGKVWSLHTGMSFSLNKGRASRRRKPRAAPGPQTRTLQDYSGGGARSSHRRAGTQTVRPRLGAMACPRPETGRRLGRMTSRRWQGLRGRLYPELHAQKRPSRESCVRGFHRPRPCGR